MKQSVLLCAVVTVLTVTTAAGGASADVPNTNQRAAPGGSGSRVVTLTTGDKVTASPEPDGRWTLGLSGSSPRAGAGPRTVIAGLIRDGGELVLPTVEIRGVFGGH